jgi:hypothetical protein
MLEIRPEQMEVFAAYKRGGFEMRLVYQLRDDYPDDTQGKSDEELREFVSAQIDRARNYSIVREEDVAVFVDRSAWYGAGWDLRLDWARKIFTDHDLDGAARIEDIRRHEATTLEELQ